MSSSEYNDLYLKCQNTGIYHMFVFERINSQIESNAQINQNKMVQLMMNIYNEIKKIEEITNKKILSI